MNLNDVDDPWGGEQNGELNVGSDEAGESVEGNDDGQTQNTDSAVDDCGDRECPTLTPRNRKCCSAASKGVNYLMQLLDAGFTHEEKKMVLHRYFADERVRALDPEWTAAVLKLHSVAATTVRSLRGALQTIRSTSIPEKTKVRNIVLTAAVSKEGSQRNICKAIGASRYLVRKAYKRRAQVDETGENLWAGGDRKRRSDALSVQAHDSVCTWWETETTVSPNKKDIKRRRTGPKEHETHATHYLQVSQVQCHFRIACTGLFSRFIAVEFDDYLCCGKKEHFIREAVV